MTVSPLESDELLAVFLRHLGQAITGTREQQLQALLHGFARIPYENLTKIIASAELSQPFRKQSPQELIEGFIRYGTGGTCFPLTKTLVQFLNALGFEAAAILADRRYGTDTHCAAIVALTPNTWHLIDPGYLIYTPCLLPNASVIGGVVLRYNLPHATIELHPTDTDKRIDLYTTQQPTQLPPAKLKPETPRYRLTYKIAAVDSESFERAWERSFSWEMMKYPIISTVINQQHIYLQKNNLFLRGPSESIRQTITADRLISELAPKLGISAVVLKKALSYTET